MEGICDFAEPPVRARDARPRRCRRRVTQGHTSSAFGLAADAGSPRLADANGSRRRPLLRVDCGRSCSPISATRSPTSTADGPARLLVGPARYRVTSSAWNAAISATQRVAVYRRRRHPPVTTPARRLARGRLQAVRSARRRRVLSVAIPGEYLPSGRRQTIFPSDAHGASPLLERREEHVLADHDGAPRILSPTHVLQSSSPVVARAPDTPVEPADEHSLFGDRRRREPSPPTRPSTRHSRSLHRGRRPCRPCHR